MKAVGAYAALVVSLVSGVSAFAGGRAEDTTGAVRLRVMIITSSHTPKEEGTLTDNRWTRLIQQEMLRRGIAVEFSPQGSSQVSHTLMMATNSAPDISFTHGRLLFTKFASDGGLHDLGPSLEALGHNITATLGRGILDYGVIDGTQYAIPSRKEYQAKRASFIRTDWLRALGIESPRTKAELTEVLRAFKRSDPGSVGADKLIPWGYIMESPGTVFDSDFELFDVMYSFLEHDLAKNMSGVWPLRDGFREFMAWMNQLYGEGLLEREFATDSSETRNRQIVNGQVGFIHAPYAYLFGQDLSGILINLTKNVPGAGFAPIEVFENRAGEYRKLLSLPVHYYVFVPKRSKNVDAAMSYLDWLMEERTAWTLTFGLEGEHYELVEGVPRIIDLQHTRSTFDYIAGYLRILGDYPIEREIREAYAEQRRIKDFQGLDVQARELALHGGFGEPLFTGKMPAMMKYGPGLIKICEKYWVRLITERAFDAVYAELMEKLEARGIREIEAERAAYYARNR